MLSSLPAAYAITGSTINGTGTFRDTSVTILSIQVVGSNTVIKDWGIGVVVIGLGVLGALLGGWSWALLFGSGPTTFLGSVLLGMLGAMAILYLLRRVGRTGRRV